MAEPTCRELAAHLSEFLDQELDPELCAQIQAHLEACGRCRVVVNTLRKTIQIYQQIEVQPLPEALRERLYLELPLRLRARGASSTSQD